MSQGLRQVLDALRLFATKDRTEIERSQKRRERLAKDLGLVLVSPGRRYGTPPPSPASSPRSAEEYEDCRAPAGG